MFLLSVSKKSYYILCTFSIGFACIDNCGYVYIFELIIVINQLKFDNTDKKINKYWQIKEPHALLLKSSAGCFCIVMHQIYLKLFPWNMIRTLFSEMAIYGDREQLKKDAVLV